MARKHKAVVDKLRWRSVCLLVLLALFCRLLVFIVNYQREEPVFTAPDSGSYVNTALWLLGEDPSGPEATRPWLRLPGYPLFLASIFATHLASPDNLALVIVVQIVMASLIVAPIAFLGSFLGGKRVGILTGLMVAVEPSCLAYSNVVLSETFYTCCLVATVWIWAFWLRNPTTLSLVAVGFVTGMLPLVRPISKYWPIVSLVLVFWVVRKSQHYLRLLVLFLFLSLIPMTIWSIRNFYSAGTFELHSTVPWAKAIFAHSVEELVGVERESSRFTRVWEYRFGQDQDLSASEIIDIRNAYFYKTVLSYPYQSLVRFVLNGAFMIGVPDNQLSQLVLDKVPIFEGGSTRARLWWLRDVGPLGALILVGMLVSIGGVLMIPFLAFSMRGWDRQRIALVTLVVVMIAYHASLASFVGYQGERYRVPLVPCLALVLALGIFSFSRKPLATGDAITSDMMSDGRVS